MDRALVDLGRFGRLLVARRENLGWSQNRLAQRAGLSTAYVAKLEQGGGKRPGIEVIGALAGALGATVEDLLGDLGLPVTRLPGELNSLYQDLNDAERRSWLEMGRILVALREDYRRQQEENISGSRGLRTVTPSEFEPIAAYSGEDLERLRRRRRGNKKQ